MYVKVSVTHVAALLTVKMQAAFWGAAGVAEPKVAGNGGWRMAFSLLGRGGRATGGSTGGPEGPRFAALSEVRAYWEGLRDGGALPRREQIDPRGIAGALEHVFLIERIAPGLARFRLAGMGVSDVMGMDVRGMPLSSLFEPAGRDKLTPALETVFRDSVALDLWLEAERGIGRPMLEARMLLLPLVSTRGQTDLALGCLALEGQVGRVPRRFAISAMLSETLVVARKAVAVPLVERRPVTGFADAQQGFEPAPRPPRGKPHLRLVKSDD
ncbi:MAG: PAS domain-containing protein [Paracoccaceae bacterium]